MRLTTILSLIYFACTSTSQLIGQEVINLINPSFEGTIKVSSVPPPHWYNCGFRNETPPDLQPGHWDVNLPAQDGSNYLGMVVRSKETWEAVGQKLVKTLEGGKCYQISVFLSRSDLYLSQISNDFTNSKHNFFTPTVLRIYGGTSMCDRAQLLGESKPVDHDFWKEYHFKLELSNDVNYIMLEAYYNTPVLVPYNGHILVDNISSITEVNCDDEIVMVRNELPEETEIIKKPEKKKPQKKVKPVESKKIEVKENVILEDLYKDKLKKGSRIELKALYFEPDSTNITEESEPVLIELANFLTDNPDIKIEVGGHTNGLCSDSYCNKISLERANSVATYLENKGIDKSRLSTRGYGKTKPIADNNTIEGRSRNQRVEVEITEIKG